MRSSRVTKKYFFENQKFLATNVFYACIPIIWYLNIFFSGCKSLKHGILVKRKSKNTKTIFSEFLLRLGVLRVLYCSVFFCVLVILSWCP